MTQDQNSDANRDVDAHDQDDADTTEIAVAAAVAAVLANPPDMRSMTAERAESIMESAVGVTLRFYAQRVLQGFITQWRGTGPVDDVHYAWMQDAVDRGIRATIDDTGESVRDIIRANARKAEKAVTKGLVVSPPGVGPDPMSGRPGGPGTVVEEGLHTEADAYHRLRVGLEGVSRILTTRAREQSKMFFAHQAGAVGKAWRTRRDSRVRTSHGDLEGDFVLLDDKFVTINGARLDRPGDPQAPLFETINCRCRLSYRMPA